MDFGEVKGLQHPADIKPPRVSEETPEEVAWAKQVGEETPEEVALAKQALDAQMVSLMNSYKRMYDLRIDSNHVKSTPLQEGVGLPAEVLPEIEPQLRRQYEEYYLERKCLNKFLALFEEGWHSANWDTTTKRIADFSSRDRCRAPSGLEASNVTTYDLSFAY